MQLSIADLLMEMISLEPTLNLLVAGVKVVTRGHELLQLLGGAVRNI